MTMHLEMVQHQTLNQAVVITHLKVILQHCQVVVTGIQSFFLQPSLGSASVTSTSTITGQGTAYIFCAIKGTTTTLETKNKLSTDSSADVDSSPLSSSDPSDGASVSGNSERSTSLGNESPFTNLDSVSNCHSMPRDSGSTSVNTEQTEFDLESSYWSCNSCTSLKQVLFF